MLDSILLQIAKNSILSYFDSKYRFDYETLISKYLYLNNSGASFVTLHYDEQLRGCIGSIITHRRLLDDIVGNAKSASFSDPRFNPLTIEELSHIKLEVSILSEPKILEYSDYTDLLSKIKPNVDGLIIEYGAYRGTFLPQVWEQLPTSKEFLEHLSMKAGLHPSVYFQHPKIYRYKVDSLEEKFDEILSL